MFTHHNYIWSEQCVNNETGSDSLTIKIPDMILLRFLTIRKFFTIWENKMKKWKLNGIEEDTIWY